jgi:hypothetical protein
MSAHDLRPEVLRQFNGTENWYRHGLIRNVAYTDGAQYVAEHAGAYWLLDIIAIAQRMMTALASLLTVNFHTWKSSPAPSRPTDEPTVKPKMYLVSISVAR